jgi:hypothetical protein
MSTPQSKGKIKTISFDKYSARKDFIDYKTISQSNLSTSIINEK